jgi:hypothetical protein
VETGFHASIFAITLQVGDKGAEMGRKQPYAEAAYGSIERADLALASLSGKWDYDVKSAG